MLRGLFWVNKREQTLSDQRWVKHSRSEMRLIYLTGEARSEFARGTAADLNNDKMMERFYRNPPICIDMRRDETKTGEIWGALVHDQRSLNFT